VLHDPDTVLLYVPCYPHVEEFLLTCVRGANDGVLKGLPRSKVRHMLAQSYCSAALPLFEILTDGVVAHGRR
jgi:hypothetical protein